jgi:hypothetical protein
MGSGVEREYLNSILFNWPTSIEKLLLPTLPDYRVATCWSPWFQCERRCLVTVRPMGKP